MKQLISQLQVNPERPTGDCISEDAYYYWDSADADCVAIWKAWDKFCWDKPKNVKGLDKIACEEVETEYAEYEKENGIENSDNNRRALSS